MNLVLPVHETEEGSCPFCFIMGQNAIKVRVEKWQFWEEKFKSTRNATECTSNKLDIRMQLDADLITSRCDYNPDWDLGYFGYCRPHGLYLSSCLGRSIGLLNSNKSISWKE